MALVFNPTDRTPLGGCQDEAGHTDVLEKRRVPEEGNQAVRLSCSGPATIPVIVRGETWRNEPKHLSWNDLGLTINGD